MTFTLYNAPQSTCSQRVRFVHYLYYFS
jgi:hypothetical protein